MAVQCIKTTPVVEMKNKPIGIIIKEKRESMYLSKTKLARLAGVHEPSIHLVENGGSLKAETFIKICMVLGLTMEDFAEKS